jgi:hypothetical protein
MSRLVCSAWGEPCDEINAEETGSGACARRSCDGPSGRGLGGPDFAVWLDGSTTPGGGGNGILTSLDHAFGTGDYTLVTTAQLATPGFLSPFKAVIVSRFDSSFGTNLSAAAAANVTAFVGTPGPTQGAVAVFTNDAADNFFGSTSGDPFDANLNRLFVNAATFAAASGHGYIGELNGAIMAMTANTAGDAALGLLPGTASGVRSIAPQQFVYNVGPIGSGNAIDAGVTFPFTDSDTSTSDRRHRCPFQQHRRYLHQRCRQRRTRCLGQPSCN